MNRQFGFAIILAIAYLSACAPQEISKKHKPELTAHGIDLTKDTFVFEFANRIAQYTEIDDTPASVEKLNRLPKHWRYIQPLIYYHSEVDNGGHHQYFWNTRGVYRHLVAEALDYYRAEAFSKIYREALKAYNPEHYDVSHNEERREFQEAQSKKTLEELDKRYYEVSPSLPDVVTLAARAQIQNNERSEQPPPSP
jgi:hypothetical protein